jgi:serine/threonine-protein kinase PknG
MNQVKCQQPGCGGTIEQGFCNRCGLEPASAGPTPAAAAAPAYKTAAARPATPSVRTGTVASAAIASTGSALTGISSRTGSSTRRGTATSRSTSRKHLGLGLVTVPGLPPLDPERSVLPDPTVPEHKRFCGNPDCQDAAGNPTPLNRRLSGHCPQCGKAYSFVPSLKAGDVVAGQYEVKGCLAYGGLGWIYLAKDMSLNRWAVLKGLLNSGDESAAAAAVAERQFLASVKHANIVGVYNSVTHGGEAFIVMEYVAGTTLKELRKGRGPLPPGEAISYIHRILGAFSYLHSRSMVYCDFKPDNFMLEGEPPDVKLIDMGGVRMIDDPAGDIYGTRGYSAPEAGEGPTIVSDLYTVGRTLAVLLMEFRFQSVYETALPPPEEQAVLADNESLQRFLLKATATDPARRFQNADEMADQLGGVLREVVAGTVPPRPTESMAFGGDALALRGDLPRRDGAASADRDMLAPVGPAAAEMLPELKVDPEDPGANLVMSLANVSNLQSRAKALREHLHRNGESAEVRLRLAATLIRMIDFDHAWKILAEAEERDPYDWRVPWYRGVWYLSRGMAAEAVAPFDQVFAELPGEPAPKLALALASEAAGDSENAARLYDLISRTDPGFVTASFGLGRCLARAGRRAEAVAAWRRVPQTSSLYIRAQLLAARCLTRSAPAMGSTDSAGSTGSPQASSPQASSPQASSPQAGSVQAPSPPNIDELCQASDLIEALPLEGAERARARAEVLSSTLNALISGGVRAAHNRQVLGCAIVETNIRRGLEQALRQMARFESNRDEQIALVDRANAARPRTWI